tara:strand:- start:50 stop:391 length:342 start_codon:yes stop_codon:yes gene_type:complete
LKEKQMMQAKDIDSNGVWHSESGEVDLLRNMIPIPDSIRTMGEIEYCLLLVQANSHITFCPECESKLDDEIILLVLETARLLPVKCCNMMMWFIEKPMQLVEDCGIKNWRDVE